MAHSMGEVKAMPRTLLLRPPLHALLLPLVPVLGVFAANTHRIAFSSFLWTAAACVAVFLVLRVVALVATQRHPLTDPMLALAVLCLAILPAALPSSMAGFGGAAIFAVSTFALARFSTAPATANTFLGAIAIILALVPALAAAGSPVWGSRSARLAKADGAFPPLAAAMKDPNEWPDIYYLIFDRYARADQLLAIYGFDNAAFLQALEARGFAIAGNAYSNYQRTAHSIASSLNLDYLEGLAASPQDESSDWIPLYDRLEDFRLQRLLRQHGYHYHHFGSWWEPTRTNPNADFDHSYLALPELVRVAFENSAIGQLAARLGLRFVDPIAIQCDRAHWQFDTLKSVASLQGPQFVFAHVLVPHPPFVLDETGACMSRQMAQQRSRAQNYIGQVRWTNARILAFVDAALAQPGPKPIIVLQSDEGPWPQKFAGDEVSRLGHDISSVDWLNIPAEELREKMAILNAIYLPDGRRGLIGPDASPVNTFRLILREYFGMELPDLPVRQYVFQDDRHLYRFHDVTAKLAR